MPPTTIRNNYSLNNELNIIHITKPAQIGGTITSTLRQAQVEFEHGRKVCVWSLIKKQRDEFKKMTSRFSVPTFLLSKAELIARLGYVRLSRQKSLIHLHSGRSTLSSTLILMRKIIGHKTPLVVSLHQTSNWDQPHGEICKNHIAIHPLVNAIIVPSEAESKSQICNGIPSEKLFIVPDIVQEHTCERNFLRSELGVSEDTPIVLFCGRIVPEKGTQKLIEAFSRVLTVNPKCLLVIAGTGPGLTICRNAAKNIAQNVCFLGHVLNVGKLYRASDVFVAPSTGESFGISAMEAALARVPMVLSKITPWTDVFREGKDCLFIDCNDPRSLERKILHLLNNKIKAEKLAISAKKMVRQQFSQNAAIKSLSRAYLYALQPNKNNTQNQ